MVRKHLPQLLGKPLVDFVQLWEFLYSLFLFQLLSTHLRATTKIGFGEKGKPMVNYPTAMDTFVIICFGSVFAALLEFAVITFITLYINRYKAKEERQREALDKLVKVVNEKLRPSDNVNGLL